MISFNGKALRFTRQAAPWCLISIIILLALAAIWRLTANYLLNQFYSQGALVDTYQYSAAIWRNTISLDLPYIYVNGSFFKMHLSWFLWLPNALSYLFPFDRITYIAAFYGVMHCLLAAATMACLHAYYPSRGVLAVAFKVLAGALFALNPAAQSVLAMAHIEIGGPIFALASLLALAKRRYKTAAVFLILLVSVRQDMGFHFSGVALVVLLLDWRKRVSEIIWKPWAYFFLAAFAASVLSILIKNLLFTDFGNFTGVYAGHPPYAHLTQNLITHRLNNLFFWRSWIWLPLLISLIWSVIARNEYIVAGYAAFIPWAILSLTAISPGPGEFQLHYIFPFIISGIWPFIAASGDFARGRPIEPQRLQGWTVLLPIFFLLAQQISITPRGVDSGLPGKKFQLQREVAAKPLFDELEERLATSKKQLKRFKVDGAIKGIAVFALHEKNYRLGVPGYDNAEIYGRPYPDPPQNLDALIYFSNVPFSRKKPYFPELIASNKLYYLYSIPGTKVRLRTNFDLSEAPDFADLFMLLQKPEP